MFSVFIMSYFGACAMVIQLVCMSQSCIGDIDSEDEVFSRVSVYFYSQNRVFEFVDGSFNLENMIS